MLFIVGCTVALFTCTQWMFLNEFLRDKTYDFCFGYPSSQHTHTPANYVLLSFTILNINQVARDRYTDIHYIYTMHSQ